jgi:hypothetical protein
MRTDLREFLEAFGGVAYGDLDPDITYGPVRDAKEKYMGKTIDEFSESEAMSLLNYLDEVSPRTLVKLLPAIVFTALRHPSGPIHEALSLLCTYQRPVDKQLVEALREMPDNQSQILHIALSDLIVLNAYQEDAGATLLPLSTLKYFL